MTNCQLMDSHIAVNPSTNHSLNHTIYDTFEVRTLQVVWATGCCIKECSSIRVPWIKLSFCESTQFVSFEYIVFWPKILFLVLGPLHLCWFLTVGPFNTWRIFSWEENKCCYKLRKGTKWKLIPSKLSIVTIMCLNDELSSTMSWVGCLLKFLV